VFITSSSRHYYNNPMLLRVRGTQGTGRIEVDDTATLATLKAKIKEVLSIENAQLSTVAGGQPFSSQNDKQSLTSLGLKHGDMLFVIEAATTASSQPAPAETEIKEEAIDQYLRQQDGWIKRKRTKLCSHPENGYCVHCMPLAPWQLMEVDPWKSDNVKWVPFHAYIRKVQSTNGCNHPEAQRCLNCRKAALDQPSYKVKPCKNHPPWPAGICTNCDPGICTITSQTWRHVDHIEFEDKSVVDNFLQGWRDSGLQRCAYLYGKYVPSDYLPLGIHAMVMALYEPPQKSTRDNVTLEADPNEERVDYVASLFGLQKVGFIWTDLQTDPATRKLKFTRDNYVLSSLELLRMAKLQNKYPNPSTQTLSGTCGSKFVSVLVTASETGDVCIEAMQVSNQCMGLVGDKIITAKPDNLKFVKVKRTTKRYIPEVHYRSKGDYNVEVLKKAEPYMPTEFFLVMVNHSAPLQPKPLFKVNAFPVANRLTPPQPSLALAKAQVEKHSNTVTGISDFHLLCFLASQLDKPSMDKIGAAVQAGSLNPEVNAILTTLFKKVAPSPAASPAPAAAARPVAARPSPAPAARTGASPMPIPAAAPARPTATATTARPPSATTPTTAARSARPPLTAKQRDMVQQIVGMGFTQTQAEEALWATNYNLDNAFEVLLR
jgi:nuclear protein localization family protein 4